MFEDIVGAKFEGVDIGSRDIASEVKDHLSRGFKFGIDELKMEDETEAKEFEKAIDEYMNENLDTMAQMYIDAFTTDEILEMLNFEMTPLAEKKIRFQIRIQQFVTDGFTKKLMEDKGFFDNTINKNLFDALDDNDEYVGLKTAIDNLESVVWDSKE